MESKCCCGTAPEKNIVVEYLYLDLETCERCIGTDNVLDEVMEVLAPALKIAGYKVEYDKIKMETAGIAKQYKFLSSPTIRVNGHDIFRAVVENSCGCCSEISGSDVNCRVFECNGEFYEVPPKELLAEVILKTVFGPAETACSCVEIETDCSCGEIEADGSCVEIETVSSCGEYELPVNLKKFFEGKKGKSACSCSEDCQTTKSGGPRVKVLGSGCAKCNQLAEATKAALEQLGMDAVIEHVTDFCQIAAYGVMTTPALVVDGEVISYGKVLKTDDIVKILQKARG